MMMMMMMKFDWLANWFRYVYPTLIKFYHGWSHGTRPNCLRSVHKVSVLALAAGPAVPYAL